MAKFKGQYSDVGQTHLELGNAQVASKLFAAIVVAQVQETLRAQQFHRPPNHVIDPALLWRLIDPASPQSISPFDGGTLNQDEMLRALQSKAAPQIKGGGASLEEVQSKNQVTQEHPNQLALIQRLMNQAQVIQAEASNAPKLLKASPPPKNWDFKIRVILLLITLGLGGWQAYPYLKPWIDAYAFKPTPNASNQIKEHQENPQAIASPEPSPVDPPASPALNLGSLEPVGCPPTGCQ